MPATDIKQILNFENAIELATQSVLRAAGYYDTFIQGANQTLPESRLEVTFATGEAMNETALQDRSHVYDFFNGLLTIRIVTVRPEDMPAILPGVTDLHSQWAAGVRAALQERVSPFTTDNLPWLAVKTVRPRQTTRDLDPRWLEDYTKLEFYVEFGIRSTAWPEETEASGGDDPLPDEPATAHANFLAIEGDSITSGTFISPATTPYAVEAFTAIAGGSDTRHMFAVSGAKLSDVEARAATVDAAFVGGNLNVLTVLIGVNDMLAGGVSDNTFFDRLKLYCNARKNAGWRVIVCTILPALSNSAFETWRTTVNGWIRADSSFYDGLVDFAANSIMGVFTAPANSALYGDSLHPTQLGQDLLAAIFQPVLQSLFDRNADPVVAEPTFSPAAGGYTSAQTITLATATAGARIKYTVDGSVPTQTHGTRYTGPISVSANQTVRAIAYKYAYGNSVIPSAYYEIDATSRPNLAVTGGLPSAVFETYADAPTSILNRAAQFGGTSNGNSALHGYPTFTTKGAGFAWNKYLRTLTRQEVNLTWLMIGQWDVGVNNIPIGNYTGVGGDNGLSLYTGGGSFHINAGTAGGENGGSGSMLASMNGANWNAVFVTASPAQILSYCPVDSPTVPFFTINGVIDIPARALRVGACPFSAAGGFEGPMNVAFVAVWPCVLSSSEVSAAHSAIKAYLLSSRALTVQG